MDSRRDTFDPRYRSELSEYAAANDLAVAKTEAGDVIIEHNIVGLIWRLVFRQSLCGEPHQCPSVGGGKTWGRLERRSGDAPMPHMDR